jgi:acyl carrier protein phosphodiesterase
MDLFYDHILAANWASVSQEPLDRFAQRMYDLLKEYEAHMPERTRRMLPYMVNGDWLTSYSTLDGIGRALDGLSRRVPAGAPMRGAEHVLQANLDSYTAEFNAFLPAVDAHTRPLR